MSEKPVSIDRLSIELEAALEKIRALPPMTPKQRIEQQISFAYGNLGASTNHKVSEVLVRAVAWERAYDELAAVARAVLREGICGPELDRLRLLVST